MSFLIGVVRGVFASAAPLSESGGFVTAAVPGLDLTLDGIAGERHGGLARPTNAREPWMPRGTIIRNDRQISAVSSEDLGKIAAGLGLTALDPCDLGANLLVAGLPDFSRIPAGSHLAFGGRWAGEGRFDGHAVLKVEAYNTPCRKTGRQLALAHGRPEVEFEFVKIARSLRGLVLSVSLPGRIAVDDPVACIPAIAVP